ncbi:tetraacyldisaccharide 4'-kinase [Nonlabens mediterrranea]|uniref:Tetraacyldisaccharide 4'-kinase n=1 Tax=Nonlabens mediterrranea TaxID=1419947 RepID=A0ABS0A8P4_9FLAO|nr:tetraacyldisaccharide 4'-kinase [Nonlabens mediterrranea]
MQSLRNLLFPFSVLYDGVTRVRNWAFDNHYIKQQSFDIPIIAVGNLSTGGTGKTPMIEWLIEHHHEKRVAILSRGYGRETTGYIEINKNHTASQVGDEPLQIKLKYGDSITSAVCEKRVDGIEKLLKDHSLDIILLDDAYQHRYVKANCYILLTSYDRLYVDDYLLPAGNLRESRRGAGRAHIIVVTKCPDNISIKEMDSIRQKLNPLTHQNVYFSTISYDEKVHNLNNSIALDHINHQRITAVTGIAKPLPFVRFLEKRFKVDHLQYSDHHRFRESEINTIDAQNFVITTEKDYTRLSQWNLPNVYYLPMRMKFIGSSPEL